MPFYVSVRELTEIAIKFTKYVDENIERNLILLRIYVYDLNKLPMDLVRFLDMDKVVDLKIALWV